MIMQENTTICKQMQMIKQPITIMIAFLLLIFIFTKGNCRDGTSSHFIGSEGGWCWDGGASLHIALHEHLLFVVLSVT